MMPPLPPPPPPSLFEEQLRLYAATTQVPSAFLDYGMLSKCLENQVPADVFLENLRNELLRVSDFFQNEEQDALQAIAQLERCRTDTHRALDLWMRLRHLTASVQWNFSAFERIVQHGQEQYGSHHFSLIRPDLKFLMKWHPYASLGPASALLRLFKLIRAPSPQGHTQKCSMPQSSCANWAEGNASQPPSVGRIDQERRDEPSQPEAHGSQESLSSPPDRFFKRRHGQQRREQGSGDPSVIADQDDEALGNSLRIRKQPKHRYDKHGNACVHEHMAPVLNQSTPGSSPCHNNGSTDGANSSDIDALLQKARATMEIDSECPVCFSDPCSRAVLCTCSHAFCFSCVAQTQQCPICRRHHLNTFVDVDTGKYIASTTGFVNPLYRGNVLLLRPGGLRGYLAYLKDAAYYLGLFVLLSPFLLAALLVGMCWLVVKYVIDRVTGKTTGYPVPLSYKAFPSFAPHHLNTAPPPWSQPSLWDE